MFRFFLTGVITCCMILSAPCLLNAANESQIQADLDSFVHTYVSKSNRRMSINKEHPKVFKRGGKYVATYTEIDPRSASAKMKKSKSRHFDYVAMLRYEERTYESVGATQKNARNGKFQCVKIRRLTELPRYVKGKWEN